MVYGYVHVRVSGDEERVPASRRLQRHPDRLGLRLSVSVRSGQRQHQGGGRLDSSAHTVSAGTLLEGSICMPVCSPHSSFYSFWYCLSNATVCFFLFQHPSLNREIMKTISFVELRPVWGSTETKTFCSLQWWRTSVVPPCKLLCASFLRLAITSVVFW